MSDRDETFAKRVNDFIEQNLERIRLGEGNYLVQVERVTKAEARGRTGKELWWVLLRPLRASQSSKTLTGCPCFVLIVQGAFLPEEGCRYFVEVKCVESRNGLKAYTFAWAPEA